MLAVIKLHPVQKDNRVINQNLREKSEMNLEFNGLPVRVIKSNRKTISLQLKLTELIMRVPSRLSQKEIQAFLSEKSARLP